MKINTLFISDVHLGTKKCQADKLLEVLKMYDYDKLVIVGDFIDLTSIPSDNLWQVTRQDILPPANNTKFSLSSSAKYV